MTIIKILIIFFLIIVFSTPVFSIEFKGKFIQGHYLLGKTDNNSKILIDNKKI